MRRRGGKSVAGTNAVLVVAAVVGAGACNHAWDALEPTSSSSSTAGSGGSGGTVGSGSTVGSGGSGGTVGSGSTVGSGGGTAGSGGSAGGSGTSSSSSSSSGTGGGGPTHCGGTDILSWDFSGEQPQVFGRDSNTDLTGGEGVVTLQDNAPNWDSEFFWTDRRYDLRGDRLSLEVTQIPNQNVETYAVLEVDYDNGDDLFIDAHSGNLRCGFDRGGKESVPAQVPYDAVAHRHWQLREDQGTIHCEASPDGTTWTEIGSFDLAASLLGQPSAVQVLIGASTAANTTAPGAFHFDNLNGAQPPTGSWCKAHTFSDDFTSSTAPGPGWVRSHLCGDGDSFDQNGGTLNIHFGSGSHSDVAYGSSVAYDMTGERVAIEVVDVPTSVPGEVYFSVGNAGNTDVYWSVSAGGFECAYDTPSGWQSIWMGQAPALPAWIGLRESGGSVYCDIYQDGAWKAYGSIGGVVDTKRADVFIGAYQDNAGMPGGYTAVFDDYNLAP